MKWYKKAGEFVGSDAVLNSPMHIPESIQRNVTNENLPPTIYWGPDRSKRSEDEGSSSITHDKCEKCGIALEGFEKLNYSFVKENGIKEEAYSCSNCGYKNHYNIKVTKKNKDRKKIRKRRRAQSTDGKTVLAYSSTFQGWQTSNNPANTPMGRLDLSEDERMMPWDKLGDGFDNEWDSQKQKKNDEDFKVIKVKGRNGKYKFVRVKKRETGGDAVQPSNTFTQKGRVKKQRRYKEDGRDNKEDNPGAWSHNRNLTGPGSGGYQMPYSQNIDADMRQKVVDWYEHLTSRGLYNLSHPY